MSTVLRGRLGSVEEVKIEIASSKLQSPRTYSHRPGRRDLCSRSLDLPFDLPNEVQVGPRGSRGGGKSLAPERGRRESASEICKPKTRFLPLCARGPSEIAKPKILAARAQHALSAVSRLSTAGRWSRPAGGFSRPAYPSVSADAPSSAEGATDVPLPRALNTPRVDGYA